MAMSYCFMTSTLKVSLTEMDEMERKTISRKAFTARTKAFKDKQNRQFNAALDITVYPGVKERYLVLEDYLHISLVRRHNTWPLFKLQEHMLWDLVLAEKGITQNKQRRKDLQNSISTDPSNKKQLEEQLRLVDQELYICEVERRAIKDIADGIAWRLFDYDRAILYELANRPETGHIKPESMVTELSTLYEAVRSRQGIAILNDLTHFLKFGDITIRKDERLFEILEVKTQIIESGQTSRQRQGLRETVAFLNAGEREEDGHRATITYLNLRPETYIPEISELIVSAGEKGTATKQVAEHLIVGCVDSSKAVEIGLDEQIVTVELNPVLQWESSGNLVLPFESLTTKYENNRSYAPFSVFPLPETVRVKLMTGELWLQAWINVPVLLSYIEQHGWKITTPPQAYEEDYKQTQPITDVGFATVEKGRAVLEIPSAWLGRLGFEFLKPQTLIEALEAIPNAVRPGEGITLFSLTGEPEIWD
jgi:hypothetical protein